MIQQLRRLLRRLLNSPDTNLSVLQPDCVHAWSQIQIGRHCLFAAGSQVLDAHGHATELELARLRTQIQDAPEPIENGAYSVVMAGEYPPYSLLAGSPARVIRTVPAEDVYPEDFPVEQVAVGGKKLYKY